MFRNEGKKGVALIVAFLTLFPTLSHSQPRQRSVTLVAADNTRVRITSNAATLPANIDARSVRVFIDGVPVSLCANQSFFNPCIRINNPRIGCDLQNCFAGAGDWRNRIRSVMFH